MQFEQFLFIALTLVAQSLNALPVSNLARRQAMTTVVNGMTVDLTGYVNKHPGGAKFIQNMMNMPDATAYLQSAPHGGGAKFMNIVKGFVVDPAAAAPVADVAATSPGTYFTFLFVSFKSIKY
jgi:cytochrome b involved in lipid metabolism